MRSETSILDHQSNSEDRRIVRIRLAASAIIKQQLFSQDLYIGDNLAFLEPEAWLADLRAGDFENLAIEADQLSGDFGVNLTDKLSLQFDSFRKKSEILSWYQQKLANRRIAIELTDSCGEVEAYNPYKVEMKLVSQNDGLHKIQLVLTRAQHFPSDTLVNIDNFLPPVLVNTANVPATPETERRLITTVECVIA
ncbi:MAG: hypothetical protein NXI00_11045 [Cytophagales bacterium]|nr:hypothetical protein [Cytophagales bacterium]